jgi:hypothetical protein
MAATPLPIANPNFFTKVIRGVNAGGGVGHFIDGDVQYAAMSLDCEMKVVLRTAEELFETTAVAAQRRLKLDVLINGNYYDVSKAGLMDAFVGHDPVAAAETTPKGLLVDGGKIVAGTPEPERFFIAFKGAITVPEGPFLFGKGNPPTNVPAALGGLGPMVLAGLKFGVGNQYNAGAPPTAPAIGDPPPDAAPFLIQRNNNNYVSLKKLGPAKGKVVVATSTADRTLLAIVQPDGAATGIDLDALRDKLVAVGVDNAVFLDGSNSAMLMVKSALLIRQDQDKDETNVVGLGFR